MNEFEIFPNQYFSNPRSEAYPQRTNSLESARCIEIPVASKFIRSHYKEYPDGFVEVGAVLPTYFDCCKHEVIDLVDKAATTNADAEKCDLSNKIVICISTIEHMGTSDYGNKELDKEKPLRFLQKLLDESKDFLLSFPIGYNQTLDKHLPVYLSRVNWFGYIKQRHSPYPFWKFETEDIDRLLSCVYYHPFPRANGLMFIKGAKQ